MDYNELRSKATAEAIWLVAVSQTSLEEATTPLLWNPTYFTSDRTTVEHGLQLLLGAPRTHRQQAGISGDVREREREI